MSLLNLNFTLPKFYLYTTTITTSTTTTTNIYTSPSIAEVGTVNTSQLQKVCVCVFF